MSSPDLHGLSNSGKIVRGARYALAGMRIVVFRPVLWGFLAAPTAITAVLFVVGSLLAWKLVGWMFGFVWSPEPGSPAFWIGLWWFVKLFAKAMAVATVALGLYFVAGLIATPFNDRLSEVVETSVLGPYQEPFSWRVLATDLAISASHSALSLTIWLTVMASSFLLNLVPGVGSVASFVIGTVATAMFLSREAMDGCMSRRRMSFGHKFRVVVQHFPMMLGFGVVASCLMWIPFLNFLLFPMAMAGGTLMYCHLEQQGLIPDTRGTLGYVPTRARNASLADHGAERGVGLGFSEADSRQREAVPVG